MEYFTSTVISAENQDHSIVKLRTYSLLLAF